MKHVKPERRATATPRVTKGDETGGDSKALWLDLIADLPDHDVRLGTATAQGYVNDPKRMAFVASRYKFCARMLSGLEAVIEVGCGDAFGAPIVAQEVGAMICTDIDDNTLADNRTRCGQFENITFEYFDFRERAYPRTLDGALLVDVLEHIYPDEETPFLANITASLTARGVAVIGTPNVTAETHASKHSVEGHVNLKSHDALSQCCRSHFHNVFMFGMNDEVMHTGYPPMAHYLWALCVGPIRESAD